MQIFPSGSGPNQDARVVGSKTLPLALEPGGNQIKASKRKDDIRILCVLCEDANLGLGLLLLDHRNYLFGWLFADVLVVPQPCDFGIRGARDVSVDAYLLSFLNTQTGLHVGVKGDRWFF